MEGYLDWKYKMGVTAKCSYCTENSCTGVVLNYMFGTYLEPLGRSKQHSSCSFSQCLTQCCCFPACTASPARAHTLAFCRTWSQSTSRPCTIGSRTGKGQWPIRTRISEKKLGSRKLILNRKNKTKNTKSRINRLSFQFFSDFYVLKNRAKV